MALQQQAIAIRFAGGIETKQDSKAVPTAKLLTLENGVFTKAISIVKRNGYESLGLAIEGSTQQISGAKWLASRDVELLALTQSRAYSYQPTIDKWQDAGPAFSVVATDRPGVRTGTDQTMPDHATNGGTTVYAWEDSRGGVWWCSVDSSTGRVCRAPEQLDSGGTSPRCCACGEALHVYWVSVAQRSINVVVVNPSSPSAAVTPLVLVQDLNTSFPVYDAEPTTYAGTPALIAWAEFGTTNYRVGFVHQSGVLGSPVTSLPSVVTQTARVAGGIAVASWRAGAAAKFAVVYDDADLLSGVSAGNVVQYRIDTSSFPVITYVSTTSIGSVGTNDRVSAVMLDEVDATSGLPPIWTAFEFSGAVPSEASIFVGAVNTTFTPAKLRSVGLCSRAFEQGGDAFVGVVHDTTYFNTYLMVRMSDFFAIGRHLPGAAAGLPTRTHVSSAQVAGTDVKVCLPYRERLISENDNKFTETGLRVIDLDFDNDDSHQTAQLGAGLYMAGACPLHYDGQRFTEQGFHVGPEHIVATPGAGGSMGDGTYEYRAWYESTDAQGEIHRGPTSFGTVVALSGQTSVSLQLPTLRVTSKGNVRICVARTKADDESAMYRVTSLDPSATGPNGFVTNDPTVDSVTFVDHMGDATLAGATDAQEPLYTNGGILSNDPAPLGTGLAGGKSRLFFTDPSDPNVIRYSQELDVGYGAEMPPELQLRCDPYGGAVISLDIMDDNVVVFKEHVLNVFSGDGPLANGDSSQTGFASAQLITSDGGCTEPASIVLTPVGLMYKGAKGIMLVDRSKSVTYVGAPVERYNSQRVTRATLLPDRTAVVFLTDSGSTLLYDYLYGQWSTFTNHEGYDAAIVAGSYYYLRTDGRVFRETPGVYSDDGKVIVMRLETAWVKLHEYLQGWSRFYHMLAIGESKSPHQLVMQCRTDYGEQLWSDPAYLDATDATSSAGWITGVRAGAIGAEPIGGTVYGDGPYGDGPYGGTPPELYQWRIHLGLVGQAIQFRFEDYQAQGQAGPSFEISEILVTGGVKGQAKKPFSAARST